MEPRPTSISERKSQGQPERMLLPSGSTVTRIEYSDPRSHDVATEVFSANLNIGGHSYQIEAGSSNGGRKKPDEDFVCVRTYNLPSSEAMPLIWLGVKDGMGGMGSGDRASTLAAQAADHYLTDLQNNKAEWEALKQRIDIEQQELDTKFAQEGRSGQAPRLTIEMVLMKKIMEIQDKSVSEFNRANNAMSGATTVDLFVFPASGHMVEGHAGDARYYHARKGRIERSTVDHNIGENLVTSGAVQKGEEPPGSRSSVYRSLGNPGGLRSFTRIARAFAPGAEALLCCDGFADALEDRSGGLLNKDGSPQNPADWLMSPPMANILKADPLSPNHAEWVMSQAQPKATDNLSFVRIKQVS